MTFILSSPEQRGQGVEGSMTEMRVSDSTLQLEAFQECITFVKLSLIPKTNSALSPCTVDTLSLKIVITHYYI